MCMAAVEAASLTPLSIACVTTESEARLFIDDGLVLVSASCVFSRCSSCVFLPAVTVSVGIRLFGTEGGALCVGPDGPGLLELPMLEAAIIAFSSFSVRLALCKEMRAFVEVSYFPGFD